MITRIHAGADGETHLTDIPIDLEPAPGESGAAGALLGLIPETPIRFRRFEPRLDMDWHPAPRRQFIVIMAGAMEITTTDGTTRAFPPGSIILADDRGGKGHRTRPANAASCSFFTLPCLTIPGDPA